MNIVKDSLKQIKDLFSKSVSEELAAVGSLGVDIGSYAVKVIRLEVAKEGPKVLGFGIEKVIDKNYRDALSKALSKAHASARQSAVISVAGHGAISRYIELPLMHKTELESSMKFEIEKYVPFSLTDVVSDYRVIQEIKDKAKMSVLIAAAKNDLIQKKTALATEVNLNLRVVDLDCLALANFFTEIIPISKKESCGCIVNMGKTFSSIDIFVDGIPALSRDIFIGGDDITKKLSEVLEISYAEAEKLKMEPRAKEKECVAIWDPVLNNLAGEIRVSLDYFEARINRTVEKILITGGSSRLVSMTDDLSRLLAIDIEKCDYGKKLRFDEAVSQEEFQSHSDLLVIALGLALRPL